MEAASAVHLVAAGARLAGLLCWAQVQAGQVREKPRAISMQPVALAVRLPRIPPAVRAVRHQPARLEATARSANSVVVAAEVAAVVLVQPRRASAGRVDFQVVEVEVEVVPSILEQPQVVAQARMASSS